MHEVPVQGDPYNDVIIRGVLVADIPGLRDLWNLTQGDPRIKIAVLDGPVDTSHSSFTGADLEFVELMVPVTPSIGGLATLHGTQVASLIFGQHSPSSSIQGVAPRCKGLIVPIYQDCATGLPQHLACTQLDLARALLIAAEHGANVINISGGELMPTGRAHSILTEAILDCTRRGILIVAAAGNDGCDCLNVPAAVDGVLAVGAMTVDGEPLRSSNWGKLYRFSGLLAPGANLWTAVPGGGIKVASGTSFASAIVSGTAALIAGLMKSRRGDYHCQALRPFLLDLTERCVDDSVQCQRWLVGRLDLTRAVVLFPPTRFDTMSDDAMPIIPGRHAEDVSGLSASRPMPMTESSGGVIPAGGCGCKSCRAEETSAKSNPGSLVFAVGQLDLDLVSEVRQQSLRQHLWEYRSEKKPDIEYDLTRPPTLAEANPHDLDQILEYFGDQDYGWAATSVHWVLKLYQTPIYAIQPIGPHAQDTYHFLIETLREQQTEKKEDRVDWISIPGRLNGHVRMYTGQTVPVIVPERRGMYSWNLTRLMDKLGWDEQTGQSQRARELLDQIYHDLRNLGLTSRDRAINYAATNAAQYATIGVDKKAAPHPAKQGAIFHQILVQDEPMALDGIDAEPSAICPPGFDCWDVTVVFFYPDRPTPGTRRLFRFSVDVSDVVPVMVGPLRSWSAR